jgi:plasmid replication initiation protein
LFVHAEKAYDRIDNFKKKIIDIAVNQINEYSDITVSYTQRKSGRTVTHLIFSFQAKPSRKFRPFRLCSTSRTQKQKQVHPKTQKATPFKRTRNQNTLTNNAK